MNRQAGELTAEAIGREAVLTLHHRDAPGEEANVEVVELSRERFLA